MIDLVCRICNHEFYDSTGLCGAADHWLAHLQAEHPVEYCVGDGGHRMIWFVGGLVAAVVLCLLGWKDIWPTGDRHDVGGGDD